MQLTRRSAALSLATLALCVTCLAQTATKAAPAGSLKAVLATARARVEKSDVRASGHLVQVAANVAGSIHPGFTFGLIHCTSWSCLPSRLIHRLVGRPVCPFWRDLR